MRAPVLSLPDGVEDFVVYCDASNQGLGCVLMQRDKGNEHVKPRRVRAMAMTIQSGMKVLILAAQKELFEQENLPSERLNGLEQQMEKRDDGSLYFLDRIWVPLVDRDGRFTLRCWQTVQKALGMRLDMSTAYYPQMDGQSKRTIQTLEDMLRACVIDFGGSWEVLDLINQSIERDVNIGIGFVLDFVELFASLLVKGKDLVIEAVSPLIV
ncbi:putative reverse transcriptase domain-containing protein [Tanacetum coccineum]